MSYHALLARLRYNALQLHALPATVSRQADRKVLRALLTSTLATLPQLATHVLVQTPQPRAALLDQLPLERAEQALRLLEYQFLALSPGQPAPPVLWATLQQTLRSVLAEVNATYSLP